MRNTRNPLGGNVTVDRSWAQALGADKLDGARRVGNFYSIPRAQWMRLDTIPTLEWTAQDDRALAAVLAESNGQHESEPCLDCGA